MLDESIAIMAADHRISANHLFDLGLQLAAVDFAPDRIVAGALSHPEATRRTARNKKVETTILSAPGSDVRTPAVWRAFVVNAAGSGGLAGSFPGDSVDVGS
jgi:hypothetical protein